MVTGTRVRNDTLTAMVFGRMVKGTLEGKDYLDRERSPLDHSSLSSEGGEGFGL
jgi:hypothetical protein